jgi:hypothetical protein
MLQARCAALPPIAGHQRAVAIYEIMRPEEVIAKLKEDREAALDGHLEDGEPREAIARLETRIDELREGLESCRKFILASRIAIAAGAIWMRAVIIGIVNFEPTAVIAAIAAIIGGTVVFGSNTATEKEMSAAVSDAEARRAALIGSLELRIVGEATPQSER